MTVAPEHDHSQSGEQAIILEQIIGLRPGCRFLDIGAGDGETFSNTRALAHLGWPGVTVEPAAWAFDRLVARYAPTAVQPVCAVVTPDQRGLVHFAYSRDDHLSSISKAHVARWHQVPFASVHAAAITLGDLLDTFGAFEVVSIDAEGISVDLARAYAKRPEIDAVRVMVVERERDTFEHPDLRLVASTPNNLIYAR
jgi:FkbM family methyltransferase